MPNSGPSPRAPRRRANTASAWRCCRDRTFFCCQHLDGGEFLGSDVLGARTISAAVAADPAIDPYLVTQRPTQQHMHRLVQHLALDVPQRLVDARQRAHVNGAAAVKAAAIQHRPVILDRPGVFADQIIGEPRDAGRHRFGAAFHHRFAPAGHPRIGLDLEEQPARRHHKSGELGDFHYLFRPKLIPPAAGGFFHALWRRVTGFDFRRNPCAESSVLWPSADASGGACKLSQGQGARLKTRSGALYLGHE